MTATRAQTGVPWDVCAAAGCGGARLVPARECLVHLGPEDLADLGSQLERGAVLDARGISFERAAWQRVAELLPVDVGGQRHLGSVRFDGATFEYDVSFDAMTFDGDASLVGVTFKGGARFGGTTFRREADFSQASFLAQAWFVGVNFDGPASFGGAIFEDSAWFRESIFASVVSFDAARFGGDVILSRANFRSQASFAEAIFERRNRFDGCTFAEPAIFQKARFLREGEAPPFAVPDVGVPPAVEVARPQPLKRVKRGRDSRRPLRLPVWLTTLAVVVVLIGTAVYLFRGQGISPVYVPETVGDTSGFSFLLKSPKTGLPARYNPCVPVHYVVNPELAPSDWKVVVHEAVDELSRGTRITFVDDGITDEVVKVDLVTPVFPDLATITPQQHAAAYSALFQRPSFQPARYGAERWAPVLLQWGPIDQGKKAPNNPVEVAGVGYSDPHDVGGTTEYVSGTAVIDTNVPREILKPAIMHELGHVVGLGHVESPFQLMQPKASTGLATWGAGDLAGLRLVGRDPGCLPPIPPGI